ncbi:lipoprotein [Salinicola corii]|uniref:Lipoprotein n=1 Tax=Salinicola corii TaxID=2606937 RepID=A0A640WCX3_9GAMM|nr:lipoprotein [Salinicola corii]KAA0017155.1 lipoprotein [Salinicola corii]
MSRNALIIALAAMLLALAGCGQKGPLYLPGDSEASKTYDPQGDYEQSQPASSKQTPGESRSDAQRRQPAAPEASPAPAATSPTAEELP